MTSLEFKKLHVALWLTPAFEANILTKWHRLRLKWGQSIQNYSQKYWESYYPVACFRQVKLQNQFEIYCCGLPKELKRYFIKQKAPSIQDMMAHAEDGFRLLKGDMTYKDDILHRLQGSSYVNRIDLKSGYHQRWIAPEDIHKIAFQTTLGLYEFLVMPLGLINAPATFNKMMDRIFRNLRGFAETFFDDIIIFSQSEVELPLSLSLLLKHNSHSLTMKIKERLKLKTPLS
ncbi:hypothetical protein L7F22_039735 [Adiantum nelumboides]|nr:hypothetical protein [Adiantum nelumboides]